MIMMLLILFFIVLFVLIAWKARDITDLIYKDDYNFSRDLSGWITGFFWAFTLIMCLCFVIMLFWLPIMYTNNKQDLNRIALDYDSLCVMFMQEKGQKVVADNMVKLKELKAANGTFFGSQFIPEDVEELYSKYRRAEDEAAMQNFSNICPVKLIRK